MSNAQRTRPGPVMSLPAPSTRSHNEFMERPNLQMSVAGLLGLVACFALNFWLFRLGALWGILGLNVTKHVAIAVLCQTLGVDRVNPAAAPAPSPAPPPHLPVS
jgi:hypothetical protein